MSQKELSHLHRTFDWQPAVQLLAEASLNLILRPPYAYLVRLQIRIKAMKTFTIFKVLYAATCAIGILLVASCASEEANPVFLNSFSAVDIDNKKSSSDIQVKVSMSQGVDAIRLFVVPVASVGDLTSNELLAVSSGSYHEVEEVSTSKLSYAFRLNEITDFAGDGLVHDTPYSLVLLLEKDGAYHLAAETTEITLTDASPVLGMYSGTWDDNLFSGVPISFWLNREQGTRLIGDFYISANFIPAYGGEENDGTISIVLAEDGSNTFTFRYNQNLPDYMEGCPGTYTGTGEFTPLAISIAFEGDDCDGKHEDGMISVARSY